MFERYTEKARRVIFFARYEASQFGSPYIETEHLLLGLLREDKALTNRFLRSHASVESIRKQIEAHTTIREKTSTSVDLPLSSECRNVLTYAAEEADRLGHQHLGTEHLLLGILREETSFAAELLKERGLRLEAVRDDLTRAPGAVATPIMTEVAEPSDSTRDLVQEAIDGKIEPVVGRDLEVDAVIEVLCSRDRPNPILVGERGTGKTAIVERLARKIAAGAVAPSLADKRILAIGTQIFSGTLRERQVVDELAEALTRPSEVILFIPELVGPFRTASRAQIPAGAGALKLAIERGNVRCISTAAPREYREALEAAPWVVDCFRAVHVRPFDEEETLLVLKARKHHYEEFHGVTYSDEALNLAARSSGRYLPELALPGKALELIDTAGSRVMSQQLPPPDVIAELLKSIETIESRLEEAILNHEFEKARFYSEEERKEKESLRVLREKLGSGELSRGVVGAKEIEEVITRWAEYPFRP